MLNTEKSSYALPRAALMLLVVSTIFASTCLARSMGATSVGTVEANDQQVLCRWKETTVRIVADASVLESDLFGNYGDLDEFRVGIGDDGIWRALVGFGELPDPADGELLDATLRLYLKEAEGERRNTIQACRARLSWTERGVTWRVLPPPSNPCSTAEVGRDVGAYEWDATEYVAGVWDESFEDLGMVLKSLNETQLNLRHMHGRQSRDGRSQPMLDLRTIPVAQGITATVSVDPSPTGGRLYVNIINDSFAVDVYDVEWFAAEHTPAWKELAGLGLDEKWRFEAIREKCIDGEGEISSDGIRAFTSDDPITIGQSRAFELSYHADAEPYRLVMHLSDDQGESVGRLIVPMGSLPTATPTSGTGGTPTDRATSTARLETPVTPSATPTDFATGTDVASSTHAPTVSATPTATTQQQRSVYLPLTLTRRQR